MKQILIFCLYIFYISHGFGQVEIKMEDRILGAWDFKTFELSPDKESYYGVREESIVCLLFKNNSVTLIGGCSVNKDHYFQIENTQYSTKKRKEGDTLVVTIKKSDVLRTCGNVQQIEVVSCDDSTLKIKSFINDGYVIYKRKLTPDEVASQVYPLLQGNWIYKESYSNSFNSKQNIANPRDSIVSFHFKDDSVCISFSNKDYSTINTTYTISVDPWFNSIEIVINGIEEMYCQQIPRLFIESLDDLTNSYFITHLCDTDSDHVKFIKVE